MQVIESLGVPAKDPNWPVKIGIGGLLSVTGIGSILTFGYSLKVTRQAAEGVDTLPEWQGWGDLAWSGLMLFLVSLVVFAIPGAMVAFGFGALIVGMVSGSANESFSQLLAGAGVGVVLGGIGALLLLLAAFFFPMMAMRVAVTRSATAAFDFGAVLGDIVAIGAEYVVMLLVLWLLSGAAGTAIAFVAFIPILPQVLLAAVGFYLTLVASHTLGTLYRTKLAQRA